MEKTEKRTYKFGLIGRDISYSFSRGYFKKKFADLKLSNYSYVNFDFKEIDEFSSILNGEVRADGLNVTIPYKEEIIPFLDEIDTQAREIGAVNTIKFTEQGTKGFNTDAYGFKNAIAPLLKKHHRRALILGTGGASKAIAYVLTQLRIDFTFVSRKPTENQLSYGDVTADVLKECNVIINCTPLGTYPEVEKKPSLPYSAVDTQHLLFDLIYNPKKTAFLEEGESRGAQIKNGLEMLELQAEKAWEIWNS